MNGQVRTWRRSARLPAPMPLPVRMPVLVLVPVLALALALVLVPDTATSAAPARPARPPQDDTFQPVTLVQVSAVPDLLVEGVTGAQGIHLAGVRPDGACQPARHLAFIRQLLQPGTPLWLERDAQGSTVRIWLTWRQQRVDWALLLLRLGQALRVPATRSVSPADRAYARAERDARAEGRGIWGECGHRHARFARAADHAGIPPSVLLAMAIVESGRDRQPWPWTLNVAGRAFYFSSQAAALACAERLQSQHFDLFDVGILQVNWHYHRSRFRDLAAAFDPDVNQRVAAQILAEQRQRSGSLALAIARYHSVDPQRGQRYLARVLAVLAALPPEDRRRDGPQGSDPRRYSKEGTG